MKQIRVAHDTLKKALPYLTFLESALLFFLGFCFITKSDWVLGAIQLLLMGIIGVNGVIKALTLYNAGKKSHAAGCLACYLGATILFFFSARFLGFTAMRAYGILLIVSGIIRVLILIQCIIEKLPGKLRHGFSALLSILVGIDLLISPEENVYFLMLVIGVYLLLHGLVQLWDALRGFLHTKEGKRIKRRVRIPLPVFISALLPIAILNGFNKHFQSDDSYDCPPVDKAGDLEVFIHVSNIGYGRMGHADVCYKGNVYTFGAYDHHARVLQGVVGEGVIIVAPRDAYLRYCLEVDKKTLTGYTLDLAEQQDAIIVRQLTELFERTEEWQCDARKEEFGLLPRGSSNDSTSKLYRMSGAKMYKIMKGKFKYYFFFHTNCVALTDYLVGPSGLDIKGLNGIITPGSYYALLDDMYNRQNTFVSGKIIYRAG